MARLRREIDVSSEPDAPSDAAAQQLLGELKASLSPVASRPLTSAARSASLLNAARIPSPRPVAAHRALPSSPVTESSRTMAGPSSPGVMPGAQPRLGGLKRPSIMREDLAKRAKMVPPRRRDPYEMPESPAKGTCKLPEKVNHVPLQVVKRKTGKTSKADLTNPTSPTAVSDDNMDQRPHRHSGRLAGDEADITVQDWGKRPERQLMSSTKRKADSNPLGTSKPGKRPKGDEPVTNGHSDTEAGHAEGQSNGGTRRKMIASTAKPATKAAKAVAPLSTRNISEDSERSTDALFVSEHRSTATNGGQSKQATGGHLGERGKTNLHMELLSAEDSDGDVENGTTSQNEVEAAGNQEGEVVNRAVDNDSQPEDQDDVEPAKLNDIDRVLLFTEVNVQAGSCQTKLAKPIRRACQAARKLITDTDVTYEDIFETCERLSIMLASIGRIKSSDVHREFKGDAYGFLFHSFARFLKVLVEWLREKYDNGELSLPGLRVLTPLIKDILTVKDVIAAWKVKIDSRFSGEGVIKSGDQKFIAPLRKVYATFDAKLKGVDRITQQQQAKQELLAKRREKAEEEQRQQEAAESYNQRWNRWRELHIARKLVEPDIKRQKHLNITRFSDLVEHDANGDRFERVQAFHNRLVPPVQHLGLDDWLDYQVDALIDGLRRFAGPRVFERIFREYCTPSEVLRDFSVTEITAKAAQIRSGLLLMAQNGGWEPEEWTRRIPVLP